MKKTLLVLMILVSGSMITIQAQAQAIPGRKFSMDTLEGYKFITPYQYMADDTDMATYLCVEGSHDNFRNDKKGKSIFTYVIFSAGGKILGKKGILLTHDEYTEWDGGNDWPFEFVAGKIKHPIEKERTSFVGSIY